MPTITLTLSDMQDLLGRSMAMDEFEKLLRLAKSELKEFDEESGEMRVELADTNRPDLWCAEGIARQIRSHLEGRAQTYPFFQTKVRPELAIRVDPGLEKIRPYVAAFAVKGPPVTDAFLIQMIQTQEKLCENYGRKRRNVAIGIYNASRIKFPVKYVAARAEEFPFVPLGFEEALPLDRILEEHPKGKEYGHLIEGKDAYPLLTDDEDKVLSMPPIINSRETGEVLIGDSHLFVEATGDDMRQLILCMNIMAANFADRGFIIEPILTVLPYESALGKEIVVPSSLESTLEVDLGLFARMLGETYAPDEIKRVLTTYNIEGSIEGDTLSVRCPAYRDDYLHPIDVVEDFAISRGYNAFEPVMPYRFSVGKLNPITLLIDRMRHHMIGMGFEEIMSNILSNRILERENMLIPDEPIVAIDNVMSETYSVMRSSILPSLIRVEAQSSKALYPHKLFEAGEVCLMDESSISGTRTEQRLAAIWASADSGFSEIHSVLDVLMYYIVKDYALRPVAKPFYFEGRSGDVVIDGKVAGHIGEIHPDVLTRFNVTMPCAAFEILV